MLFLNQLDYPHVHYHHNTAGGGPREGKDNIAESGCGLCSACMIVDHLTNESLSLEDCIQLVYETEANRCTGSSMKTLGPVLAERFGLSYRYTAEMSELLDHLQRGGEAVAVVAGSREGRTGIFCETGHYITVIAYDGEELCILDPQFSEEKYAHPDRAAVVRVDAPFLYCAPEALAEDTEPRVIRYHLFKRK